MFIENGDVSNRNLRFLPDEAFERTSHVPMTKEAIRHLSIASLSLNPLDIVYDIGAGSGSVAIEASLWADRIYAFERDPEALELLTRNITSLKAYNVTVVPGSVPETLTGHAAPTKAFIGGASGNIKAVIKTLLTLNPQILIVMNLISLESIAEAVNDLNELENVDFTVTNVSASTSKKAGSHHLMIAQNPISIFTIKGVATFEPS
jgi:precorrin-6Y C5,15-methyltransferase (decarboxylating)